MSTTTEKRHVTSSPKAIFQQPFLRHLSVVVSVDFFLLSLLISFIRSNTQEQKDELQFHFQWATLNHTSFFCEFDEKSFLHLYIQKILMYDSIVGMTGAAPEKKKTSGAVLERDKRGCVRINNLMERDFYGNLVIGPCENKDECQFCGKYEKRRIRMLTRGVRRREN
jgi:hypothetical protein